MCIRDRSTTDRPETHRASAFPRASGYRAPVCPTPRRGRCGATGRFLPRSIGVAIRLPSLDRQGGDLVAFEGEVEAQAKGAAWESAGYQARHNSLAALLG